MRDIVIFLSDCVSVSGVIVIYYEFSNSPDQPLDLRFLRL